jgi:hypothetical protein
MERSADIDGLIARMEALLVQLRERGDGNRHFLATYLRTTRAVRDELAAGGFLDRAWVERWDVAFADLYLDVLEVERAGRRPPEPWAVAFGAAREQRLPPLRHVLLGMNAHINFDLAQSLLAVITDQELDDPELVARRAADHRHIDDVLVARVAAEDARLNPAARRPSRRSRCRAPSRAGRGPCRPPRRGCLGRARPRGGTGPSWRPPWRSRRPRRSRPPG